MKIHVATNSYQPGNDCGITLKRYTKINKNHNWTEIEITEEQYHRINFNITKLNEFSRSIDTVSSAGMQQKLINSYATKRSQVVKYLSNHATTNKGQKELLKDTLEYKSI